MDLVHSDGAPAAIGPYSQGVLCGDLLFCSGQIALDPTTGLVVDGGIEIQTEQVMQNLGGVLEAGGSSWGEVVKTTIYLTTMDDFGACNEIYGRFFPEAPPARATVAVAGLPKSVLVEVEAVAKVG